MTVIIAQKMRKLFVNNNDRVGISYQIYGNVSCMCVIKNDSAQIILSIEIPFQKYVAGYCRENYIHFRRNRLTVLESLKFFQTFCALHPSKKIK